MVCGFLQLSNVPTPYDKPWGLGVIVTSVPKSEYLLPVLEKSPIDSFVSAHHRLCREETFHPTTTVASL